MSDNWYDNLERNAQGRIKDTIMNLNAILLYDKKLQGIAYNTQTHRVMLRDEVPWNSAKGFFTDMDESCLKCFIAQKYGFDPSHKLTAAIMNVSNERRFHPIQEYLEGLPDWDGVERVDKLLVKYFAAEPSAYVSAVMRKTLVAAVARIFEPGCQFDTMLVLVGKQGLGKSTFFAKLAGEWFSDSLGLRDVRDKTAAEKLQGNWIVEMSEMVGFSRAENEDVKAFLSRRNDEYRVAYDKYCSEHPRQCIIVGSTNKVEGFLKDTTGNRRYWPVKVYPGAELSPFELTEAEIEQIWAESLWLYKQGERLYLDKALEELAVEAQQEALERDDRAGMVRNFVDMLVPNVWSAMSIEERRDWFNRYSHEQADEDLVERQQVTNIEIWTECFGKDKANMTRRDSMAITSIMNGFSDWEKTDKREKVSYYGQQRIYRRVS